MSTRTGEDILATDLLAFDIRAFDPSAPTLGYVGSDLQPGTAAVNDDGNSITDRGASNQIDAAELGWPDSDDLILRPGDPGFAARLAEVSIPNPLAAPVAYGEFVDLNWAGKAGIGGGVSSVFSGGPHLKSGLFRTPTNGALQIFQPSYDTFTDLFERDGVYQAEIGGAGLVVSRVGWVSGAEPWRTTVDAGNDGIDNEFPIDGVSDDPDEKETSPPYATNLRGLQISVRLEDRATKQFKQMSTVKEFVTR
jgi:hypothetical protein